MIGEKYVWKSNAFYSNYILFIPSHQNPYPQSVKERRRIIKIKKGWTYTFIVQEPQSLFRYLILEEPPVPKHL